MPARVRRLTASMVRAPTGRRIAAREAGVENLLVLERANEMGGILRQCIHNGFGLHRFKEELTGPEYAQRDIDRVKELGIEVRCGTTVLSVDGERFVTAVSRDKGVQLFEAGAIVLAMGCRERPRGALATPGTRCAGVFSAGTAQKFVNLEGYMPGKRVVILGSGDIGLIMARRMTLQGAKVLACVELMPYYMCIRDSASTAPKARSSILWSRWWPWMTRLPCWPSACAPPSLPARKRRWWTGRAVSYTHLDVYKRQG